MNVTRKNSLPATLRAFAAALLIGVALGGANAQDIGTASRIIRLASGQPALNLSLSLNKAVIIELDRDARDVLIANPEIADAVVRTPRRIFILALGVGQTNAIFLDDNGQQIAALEIAVGTDVSDLNSMIFRNIPGSNVSAEALNDNVVLHGSVLNAADAANAQALAVRFTGDEAKVVNMVTIEERNQVLIKVQVAEMSRTIAKQLGLNLSSVTNVAGVPIIAGTSNQLSLLGRALSDLSGAQVGQVCEVISPQSEAIEGLTDPLGNPILPTETFPAEANNPLGILPGMVNLPGRLYGFSATSLCVPKPNNLQGVVQALERVGLVHTLAEPSLTAVSGEVARFLAGGEFPVPTSRDQNGNIGVEFKQFGVGLAFTPVVLSRGRISLQISTEVSELTNTGALTLAGGTTAEGVATQGLTLPALSVRRTETTVELPSGGSLAIGGLIQQQTKQNLDALPGVKDLPILGALFRSRDFQNNETELVVTVTAYLVDPVAASQLATPNDGFRTPSDLETILLGRVNGVYDPETSAPPTPPQSNGYIVQ